MSSLSIGPGLKIEDVEACLAQGPVIGESRLQCIVEQLEDSRWQDDLAVECSLQLLATRVGQDAAWQTPYRQHGLVQLVLKRLFTTTVTTSLAKQILRVVGNSIADNDENRYIVVGYIQDLVDYLAVVANATTTFTVLFNLINDYDEEPALLEAVRIRLDVGIVRGVSTHSLPEETHPYAIEVLAWATEKLSPDQMLDETSLQQFDQVLALALEYDEHLYQDYVAILLHYLQAPSFQERLTSEKTAERLIELAFDLDSRLSDVEARIAFQALSTSTENAQAVSESTNVAYMVQMINSVTTLLASEHFVNIFDLDSPIMAQLRALLQSDNAGPILVCACICLGNLATSDQVCIRMVDSFQMQIPLANILTSRSEPALLYATAGFARHLTFPVANRSKLGAAGFIELCYHLLTNEDAPVRGEAGAMLSKLVTDNMPNVQRIIDGALAPNVAHSASYVDAHLQPSVLEFLIERASASSKPLPSLSMKNATIELGRVVVAMLRCISHATADQSAKKMLSVRGIANPVARLTRQHFYADARSEGLVGLGLMAQSPEGAVRVIEEINADSGLLDAIRDFALERKNAGLQDQSAERDFQNAVVLMHSLMKNAAHLVETMDDDMRTRLSAVKEELDRLMN